MKISVKTLSGETFQIEISENDTVLNIKTKIREFKGFEESTQKLLRKGQLLNDENTVAQLKIVEGDFFVVMVNVKKPATSVPQPEQKQDQK